MRFLLLLALACPATAQIVISQIYGGGGNTGATLRQDFIEIFNRGVAPQSLDGWSVQYAASTSATRITTALSGTLAAGQYALIQQSAGAGGTQNLPTPDFSGTVAMSSSSAKVYLVNANNQVQDLIGYGAAANEFEGAPTANLSNTTAALRARNGCTDTDNNAADFAIAAPAPRNRQSPPFDCAAVQETLNRTISQIQGPGAVSPLEGRRVRTSGIVTYRRTNGFYLQSPTADPDASSGILVFTQTAPPAVAQVGNSLQVEADVVEFRPATDSASAPLTELINPTLTLLAQGQPLPAPQILLPNQDFEKYEGMLVKAETLYVVSPTDNNLFWATLDAPRPFRRSPLVQPATEARWPNLLRVNLAAPVPAGVKLANLTGPLDFASRTYTLYSSALETLPVLPTLPPAPPKADGEFTVATLNLERFFDDLDQGNGVALTPPAEYSRRLALLKAYVTISLGSPDVLVVQEAENLPSLQRAADAIGLDYLAFTAPSNDPGGITSGFLVRYTRVAVDSVAQLAKDLEYTPGQITHDRPPILLRARAGTFAFAVMGVHMRSRLNLEDARVQAKRAAQFASVREELAQLPANLPTAVAGDWNSFTEEIQFPGFRNLSTTLSQNDNYSYVFDGQTQTLDHILINAPFAAAFSRLYYGRGNADAPADQRLSDHDGAVAYFTLRPVPFTASTIVSSVSFLAGPIAPNQAITIFGQPGFTPNEPPASTNLRVLIDGVAADVRYAGRDQVVAFTPNTLDFRKPFVPVAVERAGTVIHTVFMPTAESQPSLPTRLSLGQQLSAFAFTAGSRETLFLTGHGSLPLSTGNTNVRLCGLPAEVISAGLLPGSPNAIATVEIIVPPACPAGPQPVELSIGSRSTQTPLTVNMLR